MWSRSASNSRFMGLGKKRSKCLLNPGPWKLLRNVWDIWKFTMHGPVYVRLRKHSKICLTVTVSMERDNVKWTQGRDLQICPIFPFIWVSLARDIMLSVVKPTLLLATEDGLRNPEYLSQMKYSLRDLSIRPSCCCHFKPSGIFKPFEAWVRAYMTFKWWREKPIYSA